MLEEPAERLAAHDRPVGKALYSWLAAVGDRQRHVAPALMGPLLVMVFEELLHKML